MAEYKLEKQVVALEEEEEKEKNSAQTLTKPGGNVPVEEEEATSKFALKVSKLLDQTDNLIFAVVGLCFVIGAVFALAYSFWDFGLALTEIPGSEQAPYIANIIIQLISNLLLVLIIMEVLGTVTAYLKTRANSVTPFLFIGIISATRGILSIGARLSVEKIQPLSPEFDSAMIELGINAAAILALGITLRLLARPKAQE